MTTYKRIWNKLKWYKHCVERFIREIYPSILIRLISTFSDQIVFRDQSGFFVRMITSSDLNYARSNNGYFFDCHGIRNYLNSSTERFKLAIDVGANLGAVSFLLAEKSDTVISFEPHPTTFSELASNININRITNITIEQLACSSKSGISQMFMNNYHGHSSLNIRSDLKKQVEVKTIRLDDYLENQSISVIDLLKIDVEGHEYSVICGMGRFLNPKICKILIWEHSQFTGNASSNSAQIYEMLVRAGYRIQDLNGNLISVEEMLNQQHMDVLATA